MKKLLLIAIAAGMSLSASAWDGYALNTFKDNTAVYASATVAVDASGNSFVSGAYNQDATIADVAMTAVGTSAFIIKYDAAGTSKWAVSLEGAVTIAAMTTDDAGNLYVAGTYADVVTLGSTDNKTVEIEGMKIDGAATVDQNASFIAKYTADGVLAEKATFVPAIPEGYTPFDTSEIYFHISSICVSGTEIYASALYTGDTKIGDNTFKGALVDPFGEGWFMSFPNASTFSLSSNMTEAKVLASAEGGIDVIAFANYLPSAATVGEVGGTVYSAFTTAGPAVIKYGDETKTLSEADGSTVNFTFVSSDNKCASYKIEGADGMQAENDIPFAFAANGDNIECIGQIWTKESDVTIPQVFIYTLPASLEGGSMYAKNIKVGDTQYSKIMGATFANDNWIFAAQGVDSKPEYTNSFKSYVYNPKKGFTEPDVPNAYTLGGNGKVITYTTIADFGIVFNNYNAPASGINGIIAEEDADAPVEFYNLQGVRVINPESGLYIRRQGNSVSKVVIK